MSFSTTLVSPIHLADAASPCGTNDGISCDLAWRLTHNETVSDLATVLVGRPLSILVLVVGGLAIRWLAARLIARMIARIASGPLNERRQVRARTMGSLVLSIATTVIVFVVSLMVIDELGYSIGPIIASAGVVGLAIGFGAQSLVKDYISGMFMIFEDQYGVGDSVDLGTATGTIEAVGLRVTRLRDVHGTVWYVRNGEILRVGNMSQSWARTVLDVPVGYDADLDHVRSVLRSVAHEVWEDPMFVGAVIEEPEVWGVEALAGDVVTVRVTLKTAPGEKARVARAMRERIKARFDIEGIVMPHLGARPFGPPPTS
ncbi:mechanosensitive ion channel family protein [Nocardioides jiangxiensis]|uniref:Mechanosensitive ion channel family protein n=1 Tax=Nocardioides jiangxiensis TaxID=3064524 RepID=A0ABT9B7C7_9ACTN|nr:mechanosensitive ion channel family protein [Nocardioides sp. WY-20]MDO7869043.1 mechanosensitive ion channel family protein [Nocardioides sp. WY-20]